MVVGVSARNKYGSTALRLSSTLKGGEAGVRVNESEPASVPDLG